MARRGKKWALVALGRTLLTIIDQVLKHNVTYHDQGANYWDQCNRGPLERFLVKRLEGLGDRVDLTLDQGIM